MCYPYTYSDTLRFLDSIIPNNSSNHIVRRASLGRTLAGNQLELLIVTNFNCPEDQIAKRKCVILTSRVHPGESNSSFIIEGLISCLVGDSAVAHKLRDRFVFKIVPMLNPDGVVIGNYRCSLSGQDLNR
jgi:murein tripeptide amidase MpaA